MGNTHNKLINKDKKQLAVFVPQHFSQQFFAHYYGVRHLGSIVDEIKVVLLSVFSGVLTTIFIYTVSLLIKNILLPWYQRFIYKGVDVSGEWQGVYVFNEVASYSATLNLKQSAHDLTGSFTIIRTVNGEPEKITNMNVTGEVWEGFISLKCRTISNKNLSFGSMLCKITDSALQGKYIFRNLAGSGSNIADFALSLERKNA